MVGYSLSTNDPKLVNVTIPEYGEKLTNNNNNQNVAEDNDQQLLKNTIIIPRIGMATMKKDDLCYAIDNETNNDKFIVSKDDVIIPVDDKKGK